MKTVKIWALSFFLAQWGRKSPRFKWVKMLTETISLSVEKCLYLVSLIFLVGAGLNMQTSAELNNVLGLLLYVQEGLFHFL